jgi:hypothetical protein
MNTDVDLPGLSINGVKGILMRATADADVLRFEKTFA